MHPHITTKRQTQHTQQEQPPRTHTDRCILLTICISFLTPRIHNKQNTLPSDTTKKNGQSGTWMGFHRGELDKTALFTALPVLIHVPFIRAPQSKRSLPPRSRRCRSSRRSRCYQSSRWSALSRDRRVQTGTCGSRDATATTLILRGYRAL